jgi:hypothetical protein
VRDAGNGMRDAECEIRDTGCAMRDTGCGMRDAGYAIRDARYGILVTRSLMLVGVRGKRYRKLETAGRRPGRGERRIANSEQRPAESG